MTQRSASARVAAGLARARAALTALTGPVEPRAPAPPRPAVGAERSTAPAGPRPLDVRALGLFDARLPVVGARLYVDGRAEQVAHLADALTTARRRGGFVWLGLHGPTAADVAELAAPFGLPAAAVDDALRAHQRPKLQSYPGTTFGVVKPVRYVDHEEVVDVSEVDVFVGEHFAITVRHGESGIVAAVRAGLDERPGDAAAGPELVLRRIVQLAVSGYAEVVDAIALDVDEIEEQVFGGDGGAAEQHAERIYKLKREVLEFKRAALPLVGPAQRLWAEPPGAQRPGDRDDVQEDLLRVVEAVEGYDTLLTGVLQAHLAQVGVQQNRTAVRQNEDMRRISAWAAIALVPTAVAGVHS
ncbi:CorA family divalent cation transporter [Kineococcus glutinatus]|uniref:Magnesium/cobalt transporter CorA n=1 Tax=Kineococcus glutinatus TaxID=1070872 RepID=A0ABP9I8E9_9ACTN